MFRKMSRKTSRNKMMIKEQEESEKQDKLENLSPSNLLPDITSLINERDYLKDEVKTLREHLENENVRYTELKSLKHQQVGALTFKLAKTIRDYERALEEKEEIHKKYIILENKHEELTFQYSILYEKYSALGRDRHHRYGLARKRALSVPKMSCFAVTGVMKSPSSNAVSSDSIDNPLDHNGDSLQQIEATTLGPVQPNPEASKDTAGDHKEENEVNAAAELESPNLTTNEANESLIDEFRKIQQELSDVKKNMSIVQALNERLSSELESLEEIKKRPDFARSISERSRKNACSSLSDCVDGKMAEPPKKFVFPDVAVDPSELEHADGNMETPVEINLERKEEELSLAPSQLVHKRDTSVHERKKTAYEKNKTEHEEKKTAHEEDKTAYEGNETAYEEDKSDMVGEQREMEPRKIPNGEYLPSTLQDHTDGVTATKNNEMDFKKQLERAMKELEDIRADNRIMKHQIDRMATSSLDHTSFLRKTTDFTGQILKEMKEREDQRSRKASVESQPPLNILGTRLDEIMKAVEDMTYEPQISPKTSTAVLATTPLSFTSLTSALPVQPKEARKYDSKEVSSANQKRRVHGKLSEASMYDRKSLTSGIAGMRKISEPLPKEWKSTEALSGNPLSTSLSNSLGYRDYIHRHIVMSSSAIAKIRDLTPEELNRDQQQHFIY